MGGIWPLSSSQKSELQAIVDSEALDGCEIHKFDHSLGLGFRFRTRMVSVRALRGLAKFSEPQSVKPEPQIHPAPQKYVKPWPLWRLLGI